MSAFERTIKIAYRIEKNKITCLKRLKMRLNKTYFETRDLKR